MDDMYAVIAIVLCIFAFLLVLLGLGEFYGGEWSLIAQGLAKFILLVMAFCFGAFVLVRLVGRR